jgi:phosphoglycerate dehydrogenase-like enzyme
LLYKNEGIFDKKIGLVGFGAITKFLVKMLKPFRVSIKVYSKHLTEKEAKKYNVQIVSLEDIFSSCNIISVHASQRPETYNMVNKKLLGMIPEGALLINTSRGSVIDEDALVKELSKGRFKAVLDVYKVEPLPVDSPLRNIKNAILIPHMAGPTIDRRVYCTKMILDDIYQFINGQELKHEISQLYANFMTR